MKAQAIILFDGVCNLCNSSVQFIIRRDPSAYYAFASLQSEVGQRLLEEHHYQGALDSVILIEHNQLYAKSDAALRIVRHLHGGWRVFGLGRFIPRAVRDSIYTFVARHRYRWFGKQESCMLPSPELRSRFLD
ncbi:hypothetical protein BVG16_14755 [Paenibacillus selenitireducens]|uniref:Thiol-disulfide oxidoreductase DCC n=1 Tax=Paenibacillus selenitireducens TaxID=1324314 RepID=A0A1T2XCQ5_9BACL|nr:thiol-disulfide oxidoreductase DCC family protein [Paenibacillus selenitireducens]OPA77697.1 hypothetical protein BVG16_14755 [Paenibacillus selenitireducens]